MSDNITQNALRLDGLGKSQAFFDAMSACKCWLAEQLFLQRKDSILWTPVFFALGVGGYFSLLFEPPLAASMIVFLLLCGLQFLFRVKGGWCLLLIAAGFFFANLKTVIINAPMIDKKMGPVTVIGFIQDIETMESGQGSRITLTNLTIEDLDNEKTPRKIRLRLRKDDGILVGQKIDVLALLNPPSPPLYPSGFDFRRYMFFKQIGAVGFIYKLNNIIEEPSGYQIGVEGLRHIIATKIIDVMPVRQEGIALALLIGKKNAISDEDREDIRDAGLAHMLAISGLHIGIFAGTIFFIIRLFLSFSEFVSLKYSSKKIAAVCAIAGAIFYMMIAGATIPTQRAVLMSGIVFLAIIFDRSPISLRLVSFSAFVVLLFSPESLLSASFQMSFAAVTALVYFYDRSRKFWIDAYNHLSLYKKIVLYFIGVCITTVIASLATAPFAIYHFGQVSFMGSIANLAAVPLLAFIIMPFAILSLVLMPFGLHAYPLYAMGIGIDGVVDVAHQASNIPYAIIRNPSWTFPSFVFLICAALWFILWKGYGKICAIAFLFLSVTFAHKNLPDIVVSASHKLTGIYYDDALYVSSLRTERFAKENWEAFYGLEEGSSVPLRFKGSKKEAHKDIHCGEGGCRIQIKGQNISFIHTFYDQKEECEWADVLISQEPLFDKQRCNASIVIDKFSTWKNGAYAVYITDEGISRVENVSERIGERPWSAYHTN